MSCVNYTNDGPYSGSIEISGTTCNGVTGMFYLNFGETICMDTNYPLFTCDYFKINGPCNPPTPSITPTMTMTPTCQQESFYIVGNTQNNGDYSYSYDGYNWFSGTNIPNSTRFITQSYNGTNTWVATTYNTTSANTIGSVIYSNDGLNWNPTSLSAETGYCQNIIWDGNKFIGVGLIPNNTFISSTNGINWTANNSLNNFSQLLDIATDGTNYIVSAISGITNTRFVLHSTDLTNWNIVITEPSGSILTVTYTMGAFYTLQSNTLTYKKSTNGITWTTHNVPSGSFLSQRGLASNGYNLLFYGRRNTSLTSGTTTNDQIYYSLDSGSTWTACITPFSGSNSIVSSITFDGQKFIAVGNYPQFGTAAAAAYSLDGISWTVLQSLNQLVLSGSAFATITSYPSFYSFPVQAVCNIVPTRTPQVTPSNTNTPTITRTPTRTPTMTPTPSVTIGLTPSVTQTNTATLTPTNTQTPESTTTMTPTPSVTNTQTPAVTQTLTPTTTNTPTPSQTSPGGQLFVYARYINSSQEFGYSINGGPYLGIGEPSSLSCLYAATISGLQNGDTVVFTTLNTCSINGDTADCPNSTTSCSYTHNFVGTTYVYITVDASICC